MLGSAELVAFVASADTGRARRFYEGVLGLHFVSDDGFALVLDANGTTLRVAKVREFTPAPFTVLGWKVANIARTISELENRGVQFERFGFLQQDAMGVWIAPSGDKVAWFKDPDGNLLSITQPV